VDCNVQIGVGDVFEGRHGNGVVGSLVGICDVMDDVMLEYD
jgi:hypothetical protein